MSISAEIEKLERMRNEGTLSEEEFQRAKTRVIEEGSGDHAYSPGYDVADANLNQIHGVETNTWLMAMHLTQLLHVFAGAGVIIPIIMWVLARDKSPRVDREGIMMVNWFISFTIYAIVSGLLCLIVIGIPLLIALGLVAMIFPIIGGIKAMDGQYWRYPMTIEFLNEPRLDDEFDTF